jgi:hypothetical protein
MLILGLLLTIIEGVKALSERGVIVLSAVAIVVQSIIDIEVLNRSVMFQ